MKKYALLVCLLPLLWTVADAGAVRVVLGPTPILQGDAKGRGDITVYNDKLAFALAVDSPVPYGVPRGALVDLAPVVGGKIGRDCVAFADFIPNNWSSWPNTYQHIDFLERGPTRVVIRAIRDFGEVTVTTVYTLEAAADFVSIKTTMSNGGDATLSDLLSGMTLWPRRGYLLAVPGLGGVAQGPMQGALSDRVVAYDEDFMVALHAPYADTIGDGSMDLYQRHTLKAHETRSFEASLQVAGSGDLEPVIRDEIRRHHFAAGVLRGAVTGSDGRAIKQPVVVVEKQGKPYGWVLGKAGRYEITLPMGEFTLYATARGYSQSLPSAVRVEPNAVHTLDLGGLKSPGRVRFKVSDVSTGAPLDASLSIAEGQVPLVEFLGHRKFFTELNHQGRLDLSIAPGHYRFEVSAGGGFLSKIQSLPLDVEPGRETVSPVAIQTMFEPRARHWYSADLHHHADQAEAVTPPADLARSQLAAGLDLLFVSDHDSAANHGKLQAIATRRGVTFIPGMEISPSWGHFNAYPLRLGERPAIDSATATVDQVFAEARRLGATVIQVNHGFIPYGYFTSVAGGVAPGGLNPNFDLIEINAAAPDDDVKVLQAAWKSWDHGQRYYLSAGTDTHDVWNGHSGSIRTFAHVDTPLSAETFARALKSGHAYVSSGPLIFPSVMFGDELKVHANEIFSLGFDLEAVNGVARVELIGAGTVLKSESFAQAPTRVHVDFPLTTPHSTWYALDVKDALGHSAYTDPIWVSLPNARLGSLSSSWPGGQ